MLLAYLFMMIDLESCPWPRRGRLFDSGHSILRQWTVERAPGSHLPPQRRRRIISAPKPSGKSFVRIPIVVATVVALTSPCGLARAQVPLHTPTHIKNNL